MYSGGKNKHGKKNVTDLKNENLKCKGQKVLSKKKIIFYVSFPKKSLLCSSRSQNEHNKKTLGFA